VPWCEECCSDVGSSLVGRAIDYGIRVKIRCCILQGGTESQNALSLSVICGECCSLVASTLVRCAIDYGGKFGVWGLGFGVWGLGVGVWGLGLYSVPDPIYEC